MDDKAIIGDLYVKLLSVNNYATEMQKHLAEKDSAIARLMEENGQLRHNLEECNAKLARNGVI